MYSVRVYVFVRWDHCITAIVNLVVDVTAVKKTIRSVQIITAVHCATCVVV